MAEVNVVLALVRNGLPTRAKPTAAAHADVAGHLKTALPTCAGAAINRASRVVADDLTRPHCQHHGAPAGWPGRLCVHGRCLVGLTSGWPGACASSTSLAMSASASFRQPVLGSRGPATG